MSEVKKLLWGREGIMRCKIYDIKHFLLNTILVSNEKERIMVVTMIEV